MPTPSTTSTPPVVSWLADRWATLASPGARSSSTLTAARPLHGGGAFSGKDPTKVDRSAAYAARYLAKNVVAAGLAERCMIQVAYAIGVAEPMSLLVDTQGTAKQGVTDERLEKVLHDLFPLRPTNIRKRLNLCLPIYRRTAAYGHFGRAPEADGGFSWERTDLAKEILANVG